MTQSETYSSSPCAGQRLDAVFAGDDGGDAAVLQPGEQAAQFGAQDALSLLSPANSDLDAVDASAASPRSI